MDASGLTEKIALMGPYQEYAMHPLNEALVCITSILSMLGSLFIILSYIAWKDIRTTSRKVLVWLSISDFLIALGNVSGTFFHSTTPLLKDYKCIAQSFVISSASISSFLWSVTLAVCLYMTIIKNQQSLFETFLPYFHVFNWSVGWVINAVAVSENKLGNTADEITAGWCWILHNHTIQGTGNHTNTEEKQKDTEKMWMLFDYKAIEIISYATILIIYLMLKFQLRREIRVRMSSQCKKPTKAGVLKIAKIADRKLILIPVIFILARMPGTVRFLLFLTNNTAVKPGPGSKALLSLQGIGDSSQGLLNCIFFCFLQKRVLQHFKEFILHYFCCHKLTRKKSHISTKDIANKGKNIDSYVDDSTLNTNAKSPLLDNSRLNRKYNE
eukprot:Seg1433.1 transcript_id=Seg1433.1/GoldUCD/mRNA.D3Y31 product="G-protein coupled receptor 157" protein_id=Seg1433.1/GoldUCD/D3Y31